MVVDIFFFITIILLIVVSAIAWMYTDYSVHVYRRALGRDASDDQVYKAVRHQWQIDFDLTIQSATHIFAALLSLTCKPQHLMLSLFESGVFSATCDDDEQAPRKRRAKKQRPVKVWRKKESVWKELFPDLYLESAAEDGFILSSSGIQSCQFDIVSALDRFNKHNLCLKMDHCRVGGVCAHKKENK